jgi:hypothetical protein
MGRCGNPRRRLLPNWILYLPYGGQWEVHDCEPPTAKGDVAIVGCTALAVVVQLCGGDRTDPLVQNHQPDRIRNRFATIASTVVLVGVLLVSGSTQAGASSPADQGVTSNTIKIGVSVINFAALQAVGVKLNDGNYQDAVSALAANMNAHGGVDGRKVLPYFVETNPANAASTDASCTQLTEDDKVFVVLFPVYPDCYQQTHDTPVIGGVLPGTLPPNAATDFSLTPPDEAYDPVQLAAFDHRGAFRGKKVAIFYGPSDISEAKVVQSDLKKLHVDVLLSADDSVPATDTAAVDQEAQSIALRFQNAGVNEVVGVGGTGAATWPRALLDNQSTYKPPWIATNVTALASYVASAKGGNPYLDNVMASTPVSSAYQVWMDPAMQKCAAIVRKAYPSDAIAAPVNPKSPQAASSGSDTTYAAVEAACQSLAIFAKIANAAGKNLTVSSFTKAGYQLRNVTFPGTGGPVSFGPDQPYAIGKANVVAYDPRSGTLAPTPASRT